MRIQKVGHINGEEIKLIGKNVGDFVAVLTNLNPAAESDGPGWLLSLDIGEGPARRNVKITLAKFLTQQHYEQSKKVPVRMNDRGKLLFVLFQDLFLYPNPALLSMRSKRWCCG